MISRTVRPDACTTGAPRVRDCMVTGIISNLDADYPGIKAALVVDGEKLRPGVAVAVDGFISPVGLYQKVAEGSELQFIPAIGGG